jgi:hypothetical protein
MPRVKVSQQHFQCMTLKEKAGRKAVGKQCGLIRRQVRKRFELNSEDRFKVSPFAEDDNDDNLCLYWNELYSTL